MSPSLQTVIALAIVAMAAALLVRLFLKQRKQPGCGSTCGAISPEVRKLQARLRR
ncbi:MAG TPA: FeoB-associated Cys-rich membrane protein [Lacunisphaera sp.]|nr:FeoB-associated Cys-rich membrane protein [Lacunisphaera sp.]